MGAPIKDFIDRAFRVEDDEGPSKVVSLPEAIERYVKAGMTLHISLTQCSPNAAICELLRQFWGKKPQFTLALVGVSLHGINLVHAGLVKKAITTFCGDVYPTPAPNPIIQAAYREGRLEVENWSIYTFPLRLKAGALGVGFLPTKSLLGSSMAEENKDCFRIVDDPFGGRKLGLVKALNPDLSIVHAQAADRHGNLLMTPPFMEGYYGAMAAKNGVVATVEKLVPTRFIREHSSLVRVPGYLVRSVSVAPFGSHPRGITNHGIKEADTYSDDYDFIVEHRQACRTPGGLDSWIKEWVLDCRSHEDYLAKLGHQRLMYLRGRAEPDAWRHELDAYPEEHFSGKEYSPQEMMVVMAARKARERVIEGGYETVLAGVGASNLAAWLASYQLKGEGRWTELMAEAGFYGYAPRPGEPFIFNMQNVPTCKMATGIADIMGIFMGGENNKCIGVLGAAQVDKHGNINSTKIPGQLYLTGSGGANDVASSAREVLVVAEQTAERFVERVPYITCPGERVRTLVSTMGVFEKLDGDDELTLTHYYPNPRLATAAENIRQVKENCGWELKVADDASEPAPPTREELLMLRLFDPRRSFLGHLGDASQRR